METAGNVHETTVPRVDVEHILDALASMSTEERRDVPGLNPERADIIVAGLAVAAEVLARLESREMTVSRYGIREGLLLELARVTPTVADPGAARERSVREFAERCHYEEGHATQVRRLALRLFDTIGARLGCRPEERATLADAALLHDVGYHINYDRHHKHSYHLIVHAELLGISPSEQVGDRQRRRATTAACRRSASIPNFGNLDRSLRDQIVRLSSILRVADGLDRGHVGTVDDVRVRWLQRAIRITPTAGEGRRRSAPRAVGRASEVAAPGQGGRRAGGDRGRRRHRVLLERRGRRRRVSRRRPRGQSPVACRSVASDIGGGLGADRLRWPAPGVGEQPDVRRPDLAMRLALHPIAVRSKVPRLPVVLRDRSRAGCGADPGDAAPRPERRLPHAAGSCAASSRPSRCRTRRCRRCGSARRASARGSGR
jgi:hypothetical protein